MKTRSSTFPRRGKCPQVINVRQIHQSWERGLTSATDVLAPQNVSSVTVQPQKTASVPISPIAPCRVRHSDVIPVIFQTQQRNATGLALRTTQKTAANRDVRKTLVHCMAVHYRLARHEGLLIYDRGYGRFGRTCCLPLHRFNLKFHVPLAATVSKLTGLLCGG